MQKILEFIREAWLYCKEHINAFACGFFPGGLIVGGIVWPLPSFLGVAGILLKLLTTVLFAAAGGLATVLVTDIYKYYWKEPVKRLMDKVIAWFKKVFNRSISKTNKLIRSLTIKLLKNDRKRDKDKAA